MKYMFDLLAKHLDHPGQFAVWLLKRDKMHNITQYIFIFAPNLLEHDILYEIKILLNSWCVPDYCSLHG